MAVKWDVCCGAIVFTANQVIGFKEDGGSTQQIAISAGTYYLGGDTSDSTDFAWRLKDALEKGSGGYTYTITYTPKITTGGVTGEVSISTTGTSIQLIYASSQFDFTLFGFPNSNTSASATITSSLSPLATWVGDQPHVLIDPHARESKTHQHLAGDTTSYTFVSSSVRNLRRLEYRHVTDDRSWQTYAEDASDEARSAERWWRYLHNQDPRVRLHRVDESGTPGDLNTLSSSTKIGDFYLTEESLQRFAPERFEPGLPVYGWDWIFSEVPS